MKTLMMFALLAVVSAQPAFALTAPACQLAYKGNSFGTNDPSTVSNVKRPTLIPGVQGKASSVFVGDGVVNTVTASAEDDRSGITKVTISVDLANGSLNEENTFFVNTFNDYRGQKISSLILRPEGQVRFNFPQPVPVPGQPTPPPQQPQPLTFRGSADWSPAAIAALSGKVINQIEVVCAIDLR
jgi:hypothetical protein